MRMEKFRKKGEEKGMGKRRKGRMEKQWKEWEKISENERNLEKLGRQRNIRCKQGKLIDI